MDRRSHKKVLYARVLAGMPKAFVLYAWSLASPRELLGEAREVFDTVGTMLQGQLGSYESVRFIRSPEA